MASAHPAPPHQFLSPAWMHAARKIRDAHIGTAPAPPISVRLNVVVTDVPFADELPPEDEAMVLAHIDSSSGTLVLEEGHIERPDLLVTTDWVTSRSILIDQDPQAAMQAMLAGKIRIEGDMSKLLAMQSLATGGANVPPGVVEQAQSVAAELKAITAH
jgi:hypothetical protein